MSTIITGPFKLISGIRNFIQSDAEPYIYGRCGGFEVSGFSDDTGGGEAALFLSPVRLSQADFEKSQRDREMFLNKIHQRYPSLEIR